MPIDDPSDFEHLRPRLNEIGRLQAEVQSRFAELQAKRTKFFKTRSELDKNELDRVEAEVGVMWDRSKVLLEEIHRELPKELLAELDAQDLLARDWESKLARNSLTESRVATTGILETHLPDALDEVIKILPKDWFGSDISREVRLNKLFDGGECLSLVKGLRPESEFNLVHRLRQAIIVTRDYANNDANYDHFAGATVVPQIVQLGSKLDSLGTRSGGTRTPPRGARWTLAALKPD
jgi:hypothetical protein